MVLKQRTYIFSVCTEGWWAFRNKCYKVIVESFSNMKDALARCKTDGAYLVDIRDIKEYNFLIGTNNL